VLFWNVFWVVFTGSVFQSNDLLQRWLIGAKMKRACYAG